MTKMRIWHRGFYLREFMEKQNYFEIERGNVTAGLDIEALGFEWS